MGGDDGGRPGEEEAVGGCGGSRVDGVGVAAPRRDSPPESARALGGRHYGGNPSYTRYRTH